MAGPHVAARFRQCHLCFVFKTDGSGSFLIFYDDRNRESLTANSRGHGRLAVCDRQRDASFDFHNRGIRGCQRGGRGQVPQVVARVDSCDEQLLA